MEAGAHGTASVVPQTSAYFWWVTEVVIIEQEEALQAVMATSGITTIRDDVEFLLSLEKFEKIVKELGI